VSLERVSAIEHVCHGQEGAADKFFLCTCAIFHNCMLGLSCPLSGVVSAAFSPSIFILLRHKAPTTDNMAIFGEQVKYKQVGRVYAIVQTFQRWVFQSGGEGGREVVFPQHRWEY